MYFGCAIVILILHLGFQCLLESISFLLFGQCWLKFFRSRVRLRLQKTGLSCTQEPHLIKAASFYTIWIY